MIKKIQKERDILIQHSSELKLPTKKEQKKKNSKFMDRAKCDGLVFFLLIHQKNSLHIIF